MKIYIIEKLVNELHACIEIQPNVIHPPNVKDYFFVTVNGTIEKKKSI